MAEKVKHDPDMFNNVSAKAVANGALLRSSIGKVNEAKKQAEIDLINRSSKSEDEKRSERENVNQKYNDIYAAFSGAIADVVNGKYYKNEDETGKTNKTPDSIKKINEKDGFGSKPITTAFDIIYDQAVHTKHLDRLLADEDKENYKADVYEKATEVGRAKTRIITRYLSALPGNPTIYGGDEGLAMTGAEDKCSNTFLQNRNALDWSLIDETSPNKRDEIVNYRNSILDITKARVDDVGNKMEALNNGTMTKLVPQNRYIVVNGENAGSNKQCSAVMYQATNGAMTVSLFNPNGISTSPDVSVDNLHPENFTLEGGIHLAQEVNGRRQPITLTEGTEFKNANDERYTYKVFQNNGSYSIKQIGIDGKPHGIELNETTAPDGVLMLYHIPQDIKQERDELASAKVKAREYYNKQVNIPNPDGYVIVDNDDDNGRNLNVNSND
jgi:hypothetical protein